MSDGPGGRVGRLFVPPNMADVISHAVFNGVRIPGAMLGTEQSSASESPPSRALVGYSFLFRRLVLDNNTLQATSQDENDLGVPITFIPALSFHFSYLLHLSSHTLEQRLATQSRRHAVAVRSHFHILLVSPLHTHSSIQSSSPAPPKSPLLYKI
jgi:hypothetical protein